MKKFNKEVKRAIKTAIISAFGFLIALSWRDLIVEYVENIIELTPVQGKLYTAIAVTILSVIGILLATQIIKVKK